MAEVGMTSNDIFRNIANNVVARRKAKGMSREELSKFSFIKIDELTSIEEAHEDTPIYTVYKLCSVLELDMDEIISPISKDAPKQNFAAF